MNVKTYVVGLAMGWEDSLKNLDEIIKKDLGTSIKIHSVTDTLYENEYLRKSLGRKGEPHLARVIVYEK